MKENHTEASTAPRSRNIIWIISAVAIIGILFVVYRGWVKRGISYESLDDTPLHFVSHDVSKTVSSSKAVPRPHVITAVEGASISLQSHPDNKRAQLRVIRLPSRLKARQEAARILAESGAIQECDIILSFRPSWSRLNAYCNLQLGISHSSLATIEKDGGKEYVHTVESPLSYSSRLNYPNHYHGLHVFHVIRPRLSGTQKKNVGDWSRRFINCDRRRIPFFKDYGTPYQFRSGAGADSKTLPTDLARAVIYSKGNVPVYCSELVWAILALRDIEPANLEKQFPPGGDQDPTAWIRKRINPLVDLQPGFTSDPLKNAGLMQGPDIQLRALFGGDDVKRRQTMLDQVLLDQISNPGSTEGHLSPGHARAAEAFRINKLKTLREFYEKGEDSSLLPRLNEGVLPNYSPTSFMLLSNLPKASRKFDYISTVSYLEPKSVGEAE